MFQRTTINELLSVGAIALVLLSARATLADHYEVPSGSMEPTVMTGDRIFVDKMAFGGRVPMTNRYLWRSTPPAAGDVVVLDSPDDDRVLLKRVVAGPGDEIAVRRGRLVRNGAQVAVFERDGTLFERLGEQSHSVRFGFSGGPDYGPVTLAPDQFLVMGDNRSQSHDGRSFGLVAHGAILGRAVAVYYRDGFVWQSL